jgi:hypothetical protein
MPNAWFFRGQLSEAFLGNDVLDPDKACIVPIRIGDPASMQVMPHMDAKVARPRLAGGASRSGLHQPHKYIDHPRPSGVSTENRCDEIKPKASDESPV